MNHMGLTWTEVINGQNNQTTGRQQRGSENVINNKARQNKCVNAIGRGEFGVIVEWQESLVPFIADNHANSSPAIMMLPFGNSDQ
jgi:hypothetical protein